MITAQEALNKSLDKKEKKYADAFDLLDAYVCRACEIGSTEIHIPAKIVAEEFPDICDMLPVLKCKGYRGGLHGGDLDIFWDNYNL